MGIIRGAVLHWYLNVLPHLVLIKSYAMNPIIPILHLRQLRLKRTRTETQFPLTPESHTLNTLLLGRQRLRDHVTCPKIHRLTVNESVRNKIRSTSGFAHPALPGWSSISHVLDALHSKWIQTHICPHTTAALAFLTLSSTSLMVQRLLGSY